MHKKRRRGAILFPRMRNRPGTPLLRVFGKRLAELRKELGVSRQQISLRLANMNAPLSQSTLAQYENGTVKAPDTVVLWALAQIYGVSFDDLVRLLWHNRKNPEMHEGIRVDMAEEELKSSTYRTLIGEAEVSPSNLTARHVPDDADNAPGVSRRSVRQKATEHRLDAVATRLENISHAIFAYAELLGDNIARLESRGKMESTENHPPRSGSTDR